MLAGRRQLVLISGEPGIGKTRCAEALAEMAEDQGALVLWGRCHEEAGAPPYWPWVQILRAYVDASSLDEVRLNMGTCSQGYRRPGARTSRIITAESRDPSAIADSSPARFRTFDAIRQFLPPRDPTGADYLGTGQLALGRCAVPVAPGVPEPRVAAQPAAHRRHLSERRRLEKDAAAEHTRWSEPRFRCRARSSRRAFAECHRRGRRALVRSQLVSSPRSR